MLNQNEGVRVAAEPLARLVSSGGAADELAAIKREVSALELGTDAETGRGWTVSGFNEKLLSKRYGLPQDPVYFDKFRQYLIDQNFRCVSVHPMQISTYLSLHHPQRHSVDAQKFCFSSDFHDPSGQAKRL